MYMLKKAVYHYMLHNKKDRVQSIINEPHENFKQKLDIIYSQELLSITVRDKVYKHGLCTTAGNQN